MIKTPMTGLDSATDWIERDIGYEVDRIASPQARRSDLPLPSFVQHLPEATEVGKLSAQALVAEFEKSAKAIEDMAAELIDMSKRCDEDTLRAVRHNEMVKAKIEEVVKQCKESADLYREEAKAIFDKIEKSSIVVDQARNAIFDINKRVRSHEPRENIKTEVRTISPYFDDETTNEKGLKNG